MRQRSLIGLRPAIERNAIKQNELARALDVEAVTVWKWASCRSTPRGENLVRLLDFLRGFEPKLSLDDLFSRGGRVTAAR